MQLGVAGLGLLAVVGTASLSICLTLRSLEAEPPARRHRDQARLVPLAADDERWLGNYHLFSDGGLEFLSGGVFRETLSDSCVLDKRTSRWTRDGSTVRVEPGARIGLGDLELGLLTGEYVLLTEFCTWRRAP